MQDASKGSGKFSPARKELINEKGRSRVPVSPRSCCSKSRACGCLSAADYGLVRAEVLVGEDNVEENSGRDEEEIVVSAEPDEADPVKTLPTPTLPSKSEVEQHEVDHIPHETWCEHCASVFGREAAHSCTGESRDIPVVSMDYCFLSKRASLTMASGSHCLGSRP